MEICFLKAAKVVFFWKKTEGGRPETEDGRPKTEDRRPKTEDRRPKTEDRRRKTGDRRRKTEDWFFDAQLEFAEKVLRDNGVLNVFI
jgi:hypothetical protein